MFLKRSLLITLTSALLGTAHASHECERFLSSPPGEAETLDRETEGLMAYLGTLIEHQIIGDVELVRFIEGLEKGKLVNPIAEEKGHGEYGRPYSPRGDSGIS